jgi:hypothetical protein
MEVNNVPQTTTAPLHVRDYDSTTCTISPKETLKEEPEPEEYYSSTGSRSSMHTCIVPPLSDKASTSDGDKFITTVESIESAQSQLLDADTENTFANTSVREGVSFLHALLHSFVNVLFHMDCNRYCIFKMIINTFQVVRFYGLVLLERKSTARTSFTW